jgi:transposase InsO family protein
MSLRSEFVSFARQDGSNLSELCRRYGISRKTAYKWLARYEVEQMAGLVDRSRRPLSSPKRTAEEMETLIVSLRQEHPAWGGRKLRAKLQRDGHEGVPSASTITEILRRHELISAEASQQHKPFIRFEHEAPNRLWQMDFKGHFGLDQGRCHPLTVLDDHSRFSLCLAACGDERGETVRARLSEVFRRYGLPERMTMDNGSPWGDKGERGYTEFTVWLMRIGVKVSHSRPYHPQTQGKDERFHRTLNVELLQGKRFRDLEHCQEAFDRFRDIYNQERPHEALKLLPPAECYKPSLRAFPETLPPIEYADTDKVRKVQRDGYVCFKGTTFKISQAFQGLPIALRPTGDDDIYNVYFSTHRIAQVNLRDAVCGAEPVTHVSEQVLPLTPV